MPSFSEEDVKRALDLKVQHVQPEDALRVAQNRVAVQVMIGEIPEGLKRARRQAELLFEYVAAHAEGEEAPFEAVAQAVGALLYLSSPLDLVPDAEEGGYLDDAALLELAVQRIEPLLRRFCERKGISPDDAL